MLNKPHAHRPQHGFDGSVQENCHNDMASAALFHESRSQVLMEAVSNTGLMADDKQQFA